MRRILLLPAVLAVFGCSARIQHGLDEAQANEIQTLLLENGFLPRKVPEPGKKPTWGIDVPEEQAAAATRTLTELGLPRPRRQGFGGLEMGLVATPTQERAAHLHALSEELARTLETVSGVMVARVHLVVPQPVRPGQPPGLSKASAFLRVRPGQGGRVRSLEEDLRRLVAGSVEDLQPQEVSLVISEVVSSVAPPQAGAGPVARLRYLVFGLGTLVSLLALGLVFLALRLRATRAAALRAAAPPAPPSRPIVNPSASRKAA